MALPADTPGNHEFIEPEFTESHTVADELNDFEYTLGNDDDHPNDSPDPRKLAERMAIEDRAYRIYQGKQALGKFSVLVEGPRRFSLLLAVPANSLEAKKSRERAEDHQKRASFAQGKIASKKAAAARERKRGGLGGRWSSVRYDTNALWWKVKAGYNKLLGRYHQERMLDLGSMAVAGQLLVNRKRLKSIRDRHSAA